MEPPKRENSTSEEKLRVEIASSEVDRDNYQITLNSIFKDEIQEILDYRGWGFFPLRLNGPPT